MAGSRKRKTYHVVKGHVHREHKSRLFSYIFGREETKDRTLSLYNSLSGTNYTDPADITITTMDDVVYMGMKNDLSYIVSDRTSLYSTININEHQSTENPNMPVREFMYAARLYDKYLKDNKQNPYSTKLIPLPIPKLVVLYNGRKDAPDEMCLRLSDAFREGLRQNLEQKHLNDDMISKEQMEAEADALLDKAAPDIEVRVRVVNINYGHSQKILSACRPLNEYAWLVEQIRENADAGMELDAAVNKALDDMPEEYVLKGQLMNHRAEVVGMWINEYNEQETMQMFKEEGRQEGRREGRQEGRREGRQEGRREGRQEGENLLAALINKLLSAGRSSDIPKATSDRDFRENLYVQYGLKKCP